MYYHGKKKGRVNWEYEETKLLFTEIVRNVFIVILIQLVVLIS